MEQLIKEFNKKYKGTYRVYLKHVNFCSTTLYRIIEGEDGDKGCQKRIATTMRNSKGFKDEHMSAVLIDKISLADCEEMKVAAELCELLQEFLDEALKEVINNEDKS